MALVSAVPAKSIVKSSEESIARGNNNFAINLYQRLRAENKDENMFFSPYSISTALAIVFAGAKGDTEKQMAAVLCLPPESALSKDDFHCAFGSIINDLNTRGQKGAYKLTVANALWGQKGYSFLKDFLELIEKNYGGNLNEVDFVGATEAARQTINNWVEEKTNGKIKDLIQQGVLDKLTRLVLTNAIYFKGNWASKFKEENTKDVPFTLLDGKKIDVPMMNQKGDFGYMQTETFQALEMPYVDKELSMFIFLPKESSSLSELEKDFTEDNLSNWLKRFGEQEVTVFVPKFKMTDEFGLADTLKSMGMTDAFGDADFSGMTGKKELFISAVVHKAYIDVNEEGTEAAAATAVVMKLTAVAEPLVFLADRPFLFLIRDNATESILFLGRVTNPKTE
jgi:serpin B